MNFLTRRTFLAGFGATALTLPFLRSRSRADGPEPRLVNMLFHSGVVRPGGLSEWDCEGTEDDWALSPLLESLSEHKAANRVSVFRGVDNTCAIGGPGPHSSMAIGILTGHHYTQATGAAVPGSYDWLVAQELGARYTLLGVAAYASCISFRNNAGYGPGRLSAQNQPAAAFDELFGSISTDPGMQDIVNGRRRSVLDGARSQLALLRGELCGDELELLDANLSAIEGLEAQIGDATTGANACPSTSPGMFPIADRSRIDEYANIQVDLAAAALTCGVTRVLSLAFGEIGDERSNQVFPMFPDAKDPEGRDIAHHYIGHHFRTYPGGYEQITNWHVEKYTRLLNALQAVEEPGGTVLDNSMVLLANEIKVGQAHSKTDMPFVLAGRGCGRIRQGRLLRYDSRPHNDLMLSLAHNAGAMLPKIGDAEFNTEPLDLS